MAVIVVGGSGRGVGKTSLVCGLIRALPEFAFSAVKITNHEHRQHEPVWEEFASASRGALGPGTGEDTARYLAAGATRALLVAASDDSLAEWLGLVLAKLGPGANVIFESNRVAEFLQPELCLGVEGAVTGVGESLAKASWLPFLGRTDALVVRAMVDSADFEPRTAKPLFRLRDLERISPKMMEWARLALRS
jgi:hypothetical protein